MANTDPMTVTPDQLHILAEYLESRVPSWSAVHLSNPTLISRGWESEIISLDVQYSVAGVCSQRSAVLRLFNESGFLVGNAIAAVKEPQAIRLMGQLGYPVPEIFAEDATRDVLGRSFIIMEKVQGVTMSQALDTADTSTRSQLLETFFRAMAQLHAYDPEPMATLLGVQPHPDSIWHMAQMLDDLEVNPGGASPISFAEAFEWLRRRLADVAPLRSSIIHGDYHANNVLARPDGTISVLDWSQVRIGDARYDVAWLSLASGGTESQEMRELIAGEYAKASGTTLSDMDFFDALAATFFLIVFAVVLTSGARSIGLGEDADREARQDEGKLVGCYRQFRRCTGLRVLALEELVPNLSEVV